MPTTPSLRSTGGASAPTSGFTYNFENQSTSERRRQAFRLGRVAVPDQAGRRQRLRRPGRLLPVAGVGVGPQLGFIFPVGDMPGYLNLKGYKEFAAVDRPDGWNTWVTFTISPLAPTPTAPPRRPLITK